MFILKKGHQPGVYVPLRALFLVKPILIPHNVHKFMVAMKFISCLREATSFIK